MAKEVRAFRMEIEGSIHIKVGDRLDGDEAQTIAVFDKTHGLLAVAYMNGANDGLKEAFEQLRRSVLGQ